MNHGNVFLSIHFHQQIYLRRSERQQQNKSKIGQKLLISKIGFHIPRYRMKMKGKIDTGQEHEENDDILNCSTVVIPNTGIFSGETPSWHGGKRMTDRIKPWHSTDD